MSNMKIIYPELSPNSSLIEQHPLATQQDNYEKVIQMGVPFLTSLKQLPELEYYKRNIAIIGAGKSLLQKADQDGQRAEQTLIDQLNQRTDIVKVVAGAPTHGMLGNRSIKGAKYCVFGFVGEGVTPMIIPISGITYIVPAQAHPAVIKKLWDASKTDSTMRVFAVNGYVEGAKQSPEGLIGIGNTSATAALAVFSGMLNKKNFELYGVDSSVEQKQKNGANKENEITVETPDGRKFVVDAALYRDQTRDLKRLKAIDAGLKMYLHGRSLNAALINKPEHISLKASIEMQGPSL